MADTTPAAPEIALALTGVQKHFGGTRALSQAALEVRPRTVHALLGGNGSGKSTMIKILAGVYPADEGRLAVFGEENLLAEHTAAAASRLGLRFVHQDLGLFDELSIMENFALDAGYPRRNFGVAWRRLRSEVEAVLEEYELRIDPRRPIRELRPSDRTMVAIARALKGNETQRLVLVLDEPTASLAAHESNLLLEMVRRRADKGQTAVIVSHRLQEVLRVADDFTVLRDGRTVGALVDANPTEDELVALMAGRSDVALHATGEAKRVNGAAVLTVDSLESGPLRGVSMTAHAGEIVGIAGLVGSGRSSLLQAIFGVHRPGAGTMSMEGKPFAPRAVDEAMHAGVALVPEERVHDAAFMDLSVEENLAAALLPDRRFFGWRRRARERRRAAEIISTFGVKVAGADATFSSMSGGNQQKVVIARWLQRAPRLLLLDEPTQGVDVMSRADIYTLIRQHAAAGNAVVVASSDMSELHALCDRVLILARGRITGQVFAGDLDVDGLTGLVLRLPGTRPIIYEETTA